MSTVPLLSEPLPNTQTMTEQQYDSAWNGLMGEMNDWGQAINTVAEEVNVNAANADAAAASLANAKWVSGPFNEGYVTWSPLDFLNYRVKTTGTLTIDPSLDPTNWILLTKTNNGGAETQNSATDITLTSSNLRFQSVTLTAADKKVTLPSATTLDAGMPVFVISNAGTYKFDVRDASGGFLVTILPGQLVFFGLSDKTTAAGVWELSGINLQKIRGGTIDTLNTVNSQYIAAARLEATKYICAYRGVSGFLETIVVNDDGTTGPIKVVNAEATINISIVDTTTTQAVVGFCSSTGTKKVFVLDVSGSDEINPGSEKEIDPDTTAGGTALDKVTSTQVTMAYVSSTTPTLKGRLLDIASSVITPGAELVIDSTAASTAHRM